MTAIILDPATRAKLGDARQTLELRDDAGHLLGHFIPAVDAGLEPTISEAELQRREREGGGRSLNEILHVWQFGTH